MNGRVIKTALATDYLGEEEPAAPAPADALAA